MPLVAGVDSSTQSTKVELRDLHTGRLVASGRAAHPPTAPPKSEQDPRAWWDALVEAFAATGDARADVVAVAVAGQQHGLVVLGADDGTRLTTREIHETLKSHRYPHSEQTLAAWLNRHFQVRATGRNQWAFGHASVKKVNHQNRQILWVCIAHKAAAPPGPA